VFAALLVIFDKLDHIAGFATGEAVVGACLGVNLEAGGGVIMEGAIYHFIAVRL
jgi:hypothetical protein